MNDQSIPLSRDVARPDDRTDADGGVDTGTLGWLLPEIAKAFDAHLASLRTFRAGAAGVERRDVDLGPLRIARTHLHQAHGALEMVEVAGVPRLTSAIEDLLDRFEEAPERCDATSLDAIVQACRAIVEYLEDLQGGASQQPMHLFASYRELLAIQRVERIQASDLFQVDPSVRAPQGVAAAALDPKRLGEQRTAFEKGLLRYLRDDRDARAIEALERAAVAIEGSVLATARQNQQRAFWWAVRAFFEAIAHDGFKDEQHGRVEAAELKRVAGRINLQMRKLVDGAPAVADRLFADVLFLLALARPVTDCVRDVQAAYRLDRAIPDDYDTQRYGLIDMNAVRRARDVLGDAKTAWSSIVAGDTGAIQAFARETGLLLDAVLPLKRRGLVAVAQIVDGIATELGFDPRQPAANVGLDVATALLFLEGALERARSLDDGFDARADAVVARVEASALGHDAPVAEIDWLDRISRQAEERLTMATFVGEMQANLRTAEQTLDTFFRDPTQRAGLPETLAALGQVSGALALLGHDDAHRAVDAARETIVRFESDLSAIDVAVFQRVAQNLGAVGFYVEQLKRDRVDAASFRFDDASGMFSADMARHDVVPEATFEPPLEAPALHLDFGDAPASGDEATSAADASGIEFSAIDEPALSFAATQVLDPDATLEDETAERGDAAHALAQELQAHPEDRTTRERLAAVLDEVLRNAALSGDRSLGHEARDALGAVRAEGTTVGAAQAIVERIATLAQHAHRRAGDVIAAPVAPSAPVPAASDAAAVDAELLEIFLEEANLVLSDARDALRVLDADPANVTAITAIRRGFHTLKGSGRMVGLAAFGDAAWSVEDTLNGFIADQRAASVDLRALVEHAVRYLKDWVDDLARSHTSTRHPDALIEGARAVRSGAALRLPAAAPPTPAQVEPQSRPELDALPIALDFGHQIAAARPETTRVDTDAFAKTMLLPELERRRDDVDFAATRVVGDDADDGIGIEFFGVQPQLPAIVSPTSDPSSIIADLASGMPETGDPFAKTIVLDAGRLDEDVREADDFAKTVLLGDLPPDDAQRDADADARTASSFAAIASEPFPPLVFDDEPSPVESAASIDDTRPIEDVEPVDDAAPIELAAPIEPAAAVEPMAAVEPAVSLEPVSSVEPAEHVAPSRSMPSDGPRDQRTIGPLTLSTRLFNIYLNEADELLRVLTQDFADWRSELDRFVSQAAIRAAHSLAGSSATVGLTPVHDVAAVVEDVLQQLWREPTLLTESQVAQLQDAVEALRKMLHRFAAERMPEADDARVRALHGLRDALEAAAQAGTSVAATAADDVASPRPVPVDEVFADLATDVDEDVSQRVDPFAVVDRHEEPIVAEATIVADDVFEDEARAVDGSSGEPASEATPRDDAAVVDARFVDEAEAVADDAPELFVVDAVPMLDHEPEAADTADEVVDEWVDATVVEDEASVETVSHVEPEATDEVVAEAVEPTADAVPLRLLAAERTVRDELDPELLDIFVVEAAEILPQIGALLRGWQARPVDRDAPRQLLRHLHTLKGSARMAGAMRLGEVAHEIESRVESAARLHDIPATLLEELLGAHDRSLELFDRIQHPVASTTATEPTTSQSQVPADASAPGPTATIVPIEADDTKGARARDAKATRQQAVRVGAETLDRMVNLAGEVSISRARIENEVTQIKSALSDLGDNVERLKSQLREIELQAEFQLQSRMASHPSTDAEGEKFDPLEFDRFTRFQELTRMMAESVNDVKTVQQHLHKSLEGAEIDLSSQRRMTRDLQQDLMSVRMVPFGSIAERLYRVARRAAKEVDKRVNLDIRGGSVEIDRGVLERMAGPFEHLLRNHIVHGIETRAARRAAGKDETGELMIEVRQEGNEMALTFSDDGAGLDHERIRAKAHALGLVGEGQVLSDAAIVELIFHPGFSTASEVTELAGRGIGMDVVRAEAALLGGRVSVESERHRGTRFTINLPLTLAVTQVVLVSVADRVFALPSVLVEQVQQLRPQPLADAYRVGSLEWAGEPVRLAFLGSLLQIEESVPVAQRSSPVLILRSTGERIAVHVDAVIGNQEVVVKNLGPQLARMSGVAGATVLGSGEIVLILNPVQLALTHRTLAARDETSAVDGVHATGDATGARTIPTTGLQTLPTVMVVDDSLTVRRVTQRLLSREGYQVVLAKDGVDALEQLQDFPPDAMLVDIEMPRMDGFDLTRHVRGDARFRSIPIVMITSRNADKHRDHALELGVDAYLGKPYQEDELLELLTKYVKDGRTQPA